MKFIIPIIFGLLTKVVICYDNGNNIKDQQMTILILLMLLYFLILITLITIAILIAIEIKNKKENPSNP